MGRSVVIRSSERSDPPVSTEISGASAIGSDHRKEFNLAAFGTTFENDDTQPVPTKVRRKVYTKQRYEEILRRIKYWDVVEGFIDNKTGKHVTQKELRESCESSWFDVRNRYRIASVETSPGRPPVEHLQCRNKRDDDVWRIIVHQEMVFDAIHACHIAARHQKLRGTRTVVTQYYFNLTDDLIQTFIEKCPLCNKTDLRPIVPVFNSGNNHCREKVTVFTVDYSTTPATDPYGNAMHFLLIVQDNGTGFTVLRAIPSMQSTILKYELKYIFSMIGCPRMVFLEEEHLSELRNGPIYEVFRQWEPTCEIGTRTVDPIASRVKDLISTIGSGGIKMDKNEYNDDPGGTNWLTWVQAAMMEMNKSTCPSVFGNDKSPVVLDSTVCKTRTTCEMGVSKVLEVEDATSLAGLHCMSPTVATVDEETSMAVHAGTSCTLIETVDAPIPEIGLREDSKCTDIASQANLPSLDEIDIALRNPKYEVVQGNIGHALRDDSCERIQICGKSFSVVHPKLRCRFCVDQTLHGPPVLWVAEQSYYDCLATGTLWWRVDVLRTFATLKSHDGHQQKIDHVIYVDSGTPTPNEKLFKAGSCEDTLPKSVKEIVTVAMSGRHFAVLNIKLPPNCTTVVFDGMSTKKTDLRQWEVHQDYILSRYRIAKSKENQKPWTIRHHLPIGDLCVPLKVLQEDSHSCGPIACRVLWELFCPFEFNHKYKGLDRDLKNRVANWRKIGIDEMKRLIACYEKDMWLKKRRKRTFGSIDVT
jgi:hypothetical protein